MILSMNAQASLFLLMVIAGGCIGLLYDILRIFRKMIPHTGIIIQLEDGVYWIVVIFLMFLVLLQKNNGEIRVFVLFGAFLGMILYYLILSPLINGISDRIVWVIKYVVTLFLTIVLTPFRLLYLLFRRPVTKARYFLKAKQKKLLHCGKFYVKIKKQEVSRNARILFRNAQHRK